MRLAPQPTAGARVRILLAAVCRFCTLHRRNRRISQVPRQLLAECAKTAQAHFLFRQMIAKSLHGRRVHERIASGRSAFTWTEERHRRCSTADWMSEIG